jgi:hypothetical protein
MSIAIVGTSCEIESMPILCQRFSTFSYLHKKKYSHTLGVMMSFSNIVNNWNFDLSCKAFFNFNMAIAMYVIARA